MKILRFVFSSMLKVRSSARSFSSSCFDWQFFFVSDVFFCVFFLGPNPGFPWNCKKTKHAFSAFPFSWLPFGKGWAKKLPMALTSGKRWTGCQSLRRTSSTWHSRASTMVCTSIVWFLTSWTSTSDQLWLIERDLKYDMSLKKLQGGAPSSYKSCKWPYRWVAGVITPKKWSYNPWERTLT